MSKQRTTRQTIVPDMYSTILQVYDDFYAGASSLQTIKEIGEYLNVTFSDLFECKYSFDESAYRKTYKWLKRGIERGIQENAPLKEIGRIANSRLKLQKERTILTETKKIVNKQIKKQTINQLLSDEMLSYYKQHTRKEFKLKPQKPKSICEEYPIYVWADLHYGLQMLVNNKERKTKNIYNTKIAEQSFINFIDYIIDDVRKNKYDKIGIAGLGDDIEGILRPSAMLDIAQGMIEQTMECADLYISGIELLLNSIGDNVNVDLFFVTSSNHSQIRLFGAKRNEVPDEDFGHIIANQLIKRFKDVKNMSIAVDDVLVVNILNKKIAMLHGHQFTLNSVFKNISALYENVDYVIVGHYHHFETQTQLAKEHYNQSLILAPGIVGDTKYSQSSGYSSAPQGLKLVVDKHSGVSQFHLFNVR